MTNPRPMHSQWEPHDKDRADIAILRSMLLARQIDLDALPR